MAALGRSKRAPHGPSLGAGDFQGLVTGLVVFALLLAGTASARALTPVTVLHVFLAVGQSNMSGRGLPAGATNDPPDPRIFQYGAHVRTFRTATVPLDMHDTPSGISPATTMAREYLKSQPANVGVLIIPAAHGATAFTDAAATLTWSVGAASAPRFDLPSLAVNQTREGLAAARAAGYSVELKGILWHQGESNSTMSTSAYSAKLDQLIAFFRTRLAAPKLPFVVGRMTPEGIATTAGRANVDRSHSETPGRVAYTGYAPSMAGATNAGETVHFSRAGIEFLGKTYLSGYMQALANATAAGSAAVSMEPARFLDTRSSSGPVGGGRSVTFQVAGAKGVPADASAVVVNLTVTEPTSFGFITAYATGRAKPNTSNLNYGARQTVPNLAIVPVGAGGQITLVNTSAGSVQLIADVSAYFRAASGPGAFKALAPLRMLDTRSSTGAVAPNGAVSVKVRGVAGIPAGASAVVMNLTVTEPRSFGFLTAYASGTGKPNASNVNYSAGQTVPNLVVVPVGADGNVTVFNSSAGSAHVVADVSGYFLTGTPAQPGAFGYLAATRFLDTRVSSGRVAAGGSVVFQVRGVQGIPSNTAAVVVNLTITEAGSYGFLTAFASGSVKPNTSNLNYARGQTVPNLAVVPVGADGKVRITNTSGGAVQVIADVSGYLLS
jgi:hypothetical protein